MCTLCCFESGSGIIHLPACLPACLRMIFIHFKPTYFSYLQTVTKCRSTSLQLSKPTILNRIKWNSKPPSPQIKDEAQRKGKRVIFPSSIFFWGGGGGGGGGEGGFKFSIYFVQDCSFFGNIRKQNVLQSAACDPALSTSRLCLS